jgi:S-DNA-T family DNA segregation ATPase FtsK/SpoIIIE
MDKRYEILEQNKVRNMKEYNQLGKEQIPYIVVVIDEFCDLIMSEGKKFETPVAKLAQLGRAVGIHLIIATQRPSTNIITKTIKANFPVRVAFRTISMIDSRTILDNPGANQLIGRGDMLFTQGGDLTRIQCAFIDTPEVERVVKFISEQQLN